MNVIESENHWRVSHSGYSIRCGYTDDFRIICEYPGSREPGKLDGKRFEQWLKDAEHICELHNSTLAAAPQPPVEVTDEMCKQAYRVKWAREPHALEDIDSEDIEWAREWLQAWQQVLGPQLGMVTREELARAVEDAFKEGIMKQREAYVMGKTHHEAWLNSNARKALGGGE